VWDDGVRGVRKEERVEQLVVGPNKIRDSWIGRNDLKLESDVVWPHCGSQTCSTAWWCDPWTVVSGVSFLVYVLPLITVTLPGIEDLFLDIQPYRRNLKSAEDAIIDRSTVPGTSMRSAIKRNVMSKK
jgi:hypothetical protein